jgi:hypothetical protein
MRTTNDDTLFEIPDAIKNRRRPINNKSAIRHWKNVNQILTHYNRDEVEPWTALAPGLTLDDVADSCVFLEENGEMVFGRTEQEACERLAESQGLSILWPISPAPADLTQPSTTFPKMSSGSRKSKCVTHHFACECREQQWKDLEEDLRETVRQLEISSGKLAESRVMLDEIKSVLLDPVRTHAMMLRGEIAWTPDRLRHLLGDDDLLNVARRCELWLSTLPEGRAMQITCQRAIEKSGGF